MQPAASVLVLRVITISRSARAVQNICKMNVAGSANLMRWHVLGHECMTGSDLSMGILGVCHALQTNSPINIRELAGEHKFPLLTGHNPDFCACNKCNCPRCRKFLQPLCKKPAYKPKLSAPLNFSSCYRSQLSYTG